MIGTTCNLLAACTTTAAAASNPAVFSVQVNPVVHQDQWMIAVDKPAGLAVHPAGRRLGGTLIHYLHDRFRSDDPAIDRVPRLLHRILTSFLGSWLRRRARRFP